LGVGATWAFSDKGLAIVEELEGDGEAETETAARAITERMNLLNCILSTTIVVVRSYQGIVGEKSKIWRPFIS
jgi:hypothetical protein